MMRWNSVSSTDSTSSVRLGVSGHISHHGCPVVSVLASAGDHLRRGRTPPRTYCLQEFANGNRVIDRMYGFLTRFL